MNERNYLLWLDDMRDPHDFYKGDRTQGLSNIEVYTRVMHIPENVQIAWVKNGDEFKEAIRNLGIPTAVCFDHDLGESSISGMDCLNWLIDYYMDHYEALDNKFPICESQSDNPAGRENIMAKYNNFIKYWNK